MFYQIYTFFFTFLTLGIRALKSRLGEIAIALGLAIPPFNTFHYIHTKVRLWAVSYKSFESQWTDNVFARRLWGKKDDPSRSTKKCFSRLDQLNCFLPFVLIWAIVNLNVKFAVVMLTWFQISLLYQKSWWWSHWNWLNSIQKTSPFYPASRGFSLVWLLVF